MNSAVNQARITTINSELRRLNTNLDDVNISLNRANTKLETLTTARNQLNTLLDNYFRFPTDYSNIGSSIWDNQFRGSLRLDVRVHLQEIETHLQTLKSQHEDRLNIINDAIRTAENNVTSFRSEINGINNRISLLEGERRTLQWA